MYQSDISIGITRASREETSRSRWEITRKILPSKRSQSRARIFRIGGGENCEKRRQFRWAEWRVKQTVVAQPSNHAQVSAWSFSAVMESRGRGIAIGTSEIGNDVAASARWKLPVCCCGTCRRMLSPIPIAVANESKSKGRQQPSVLSTQIGRKVESTAHVYVFPYAFSPPLPFPQPFLAPSLRPRFVALFFSQIHQSVSRWFVCTIWCKGFQVAGTNRARSPSWKFPRLYWRTLLWNESCCTSGIDRRIKSDFFCKCWIVSVISCIY